MNRKTVSAIAIAVLLVFSIFIFRIYSTSSNVSTQFTLVGEWNLDSVYNPTDSSESFTEPNAQPEKNIHFFFKADSTLEQLIGNDTTRMRYYLQKDALYINKDSAYTAFPVQHISDSTFSFRPGDSLVYVLKRR